MIKTCTICEVVIQTSLKPNTCQFMTLDTKTDVIQKLDFFSSEKGEYNPSNKGIYLEGNLTLTLTVLNPENLLIKKYLVRQRIHSIKFTHIGKRYDIIRIHDSFTGLKKLGLERFLNNIIQTEVLLSVVSCNTEDPERY